MADANDVDYRSINREQDAINAATTTVEEFPQFHSKVRRLVRERIMIRMPLQIIDLP